MEVGDYARIENSSLNLQRIGKIKEIIHFIHTDIGTYDKENIIKSSPNIIDLIEVGDYVNGERVINIIKKYKYLEVSDEEIVIDEKDIKSIVTKEQFESMMYKL